MLPIHLLLHISITIESIFLPAHLSSNCPRLTLICRLLTNPYFGLLLPSIPPCQFHPSFFLHRPLLCPNIPPFRTTPGYTAQMGRGWVYLRVSFLVQAWASTVHGSHSRLLGPKISRTHRFCDRKSSRPSTTSPKLLFLNIMT